MTSGHLVGWSVKFETLHEGTSAAALHRWGAARKSTARLTGYRDAPLTEARHRRPTHTKEPRTKIYST